MTPTRSRRPLADTVDVPGPIRVAYFDEPLLIFGRDGLHVDPRAGIARFGPRSFGTGRHPSTLRVGFVGTAETTATARGWIDENADGRRGNEKHPEFPGYRPDRGFHAGLVYDAAWDEPITQSELKEVLKDKVPQRDRFEAAVALIDQKLRLLAERDLPPEYVVLAFPESLVARCKVADYHDKELGMVHRDLRRAVKAAAMRYRLPTQILRQPTMEGRDPTHPSKIAWNYMTGLYFKAGGVPWAPHGLEAGTCFLGVSFYRPMGSKRHTMQTSLVQAFDEHGDGLVLRGHDFEWDPDVEGSPSPHLTGEQAAELIRIALDAYEAYMKQPPQRVVVHKRSRYWPDERDGFEGMLGRRVRRYDLMALAAQSEARLLPTSIYPPLRGTQFGVGDHDYLYTTGFIAALNEFHGLHVPAPLGIADHVGQDTAREALLREVLLLTKMNWNSANLGGSLPITLRFSQLVGEILREVPADRDPLPQFKYYM